MAANRIKGITIEIDGNTTKLQDSLKDVDKQLKTTQTNLRDINKLLKLDPKNTELVAQKQKNLKASHLEKLSNTLGLDSVELMKLDANRPEPVITFSTDNNLYKAFEVADDLTDNQIDRLRRYLDFLQSDNSN